MAVPPLERRASRTRRPVAAVEPPGGGAASSSSWAPRTTSALARLGHGLERVVPVGDWIGPIVVPLMGLLRWVHGHVGNYGWSIVVLTVLINLAMAPVPPLQHRERPQDGQARRPRCG